MSIHNHRASTTAGCMSVDERKCAPSPPPGPGGRTGKIVEVHMMVPDIMGSPRIEIGVEEVLAVRTE